MAIFTRLADNAVLDTANSLAPINNITGLYNLKRTRSYTYGRIGQSIPLSSSIDQKTFQLEFLNLDDSGNAHMNLDRFFSHSGWYEVTDPDFGVTSLRFTVVAIDSTPFNGKDIITITCQAQYGDFVEETRQVLFTQSLAAGTAFAGWSGAYSNGTDVDAELILTITAPSSVIWTAGTVLDISHGGLEVNAVIGDFTKGGAATTWTGLRFSLGSHSEVLDGFGLVKPIGTTFFKIPPAASGTAAVSTFNNPVASGVLTVKLEAVSIEQASTWW